MVVSYLLTSMSSPHDLSVVGTKKFFLVQNGPNIYRVYEQFKPVWRGINALSDLYCEMRPKERRLFRGQHPAADESCSIFYNVKPILGDWVNSKASMPERDFVKFDLYFEIQMHFYSQSNVN